MGLNWQRAKVRVGQQTPLERSFAWAGDAKALAKYAGQGKPERVRRISLDSAEGRRIAASAMNSLKSR